MVTAPIVVADLTDHNSNVFWELGVRQSFKNGTITIAEDNVKIPFNLSGKSILFYSSDYSKNKGFEKDLKLALEDCIDNPDRPDSIVMETLSGRGTLFEIFQRDEAIRRLDGLLYELDRNYFVLSNTIYLIDDYEKNEKKNLIPTDRIRLRSTDLLLSDRYIKAEDDFYDKLSEYWIDFNSFNSTLEKWDNENYNTYKNWIAQRKNKLFTIYGETKLCVEKVYNKLNEKY